MQQRRLGKMKSRGNVTERCKSLFMVGCFVSFSYRVILC